MILPLVQPEVKLSIPAGPHHFVAVGGFVLKPVKEHVSGSKEYSDYEVLVVQEKHGPTASMKDYWKLPGGSVDAMEDLAVTGPREVFEETGIKTSFNKICCIQEFQYGTKNMLKKRGTEFYIICSLILEPGEETREIKIQESEIANGKWMNLETWLNSSVYKNRRSVFSKLMRTATDVALGIRPGLDYSVGKFGKLKQYIYLAGKL